MCVLIQYCPPVTAEVQMWLEEPGNILEKQICVAIYSFTHGFVYL